MSDHRQPSQPDDPTVPLRVDEDRAPHSEQSTSQDGLDDDERTCVTTQDRSSELELGDVDVGAIALARQRQLLLAEMFGISRSPPRLAHYELLDELGHGGMGVVHAAYDARLDRKVAIKQLREDTTSTSLRRRFASEAKAMAQLSHPNVVSIHEIGEAEGAPYIVMEYVEGLTLRAWLRAQPRPLALIVEVLRDAGRGLAAAHAKGMIHRDFKPANVMVGDDGRVRVMDFGLARADPQHADTGRAGWSKRGARSLELTARGALIGTPAYMALEQLREGWADPRSDQFAYCVTFYEALYGARPFVAPTVRGLRALIEAGDIPPAPRHSRVPAWLRELVLRGLAADPRARFESMEQLLAALDEGLEHDAELNPPPAYVLAVHADVDKLEVLRLCASLLDHGVRAWLDVWELPEEVGAASARALRARERLRDAPALLLCRGAAPLEDVLERERGGLAQALRERIEADPSSVHRVRLPHAPALQHALDAPELALAESSWAQSVHALARRIGIDHRRTRWLVDEALRTHLPAAQLCPYRGLESFDERDARWMFGRERETQKLLTALAEGATRFMTLVGSSGSGKSSLVKGGVCPALRCGALPGPRWKIVKLRPGANPCEALARALVEVQAASRVSDESIADALLATQLRDELLASSETTARLLRFLAATWAEPTQVLLVVDQLEELFTAARLGHDDASPEAMAFVDNLVAAAQPDSPLWVIATLRADFVQRALEVPPLARVLERGTYIALPPMGEQQLREAIERPARRVGFEVEPRLVEKLVNAAAGRAGQLPLLQHVLRELWLRRDQDQRVLPFAVYEETGGLEGAIAVAAERALAQLRATLGVKAELLTRGVMTRLVHLGGGEAGHTRRRVAALELGADEHTRLVLETFIREARVLVASRVGGEEVLEIAHEALLREWSTLVAWLAADRDALRVRQELSAAASQRQAQANDEYLWGRGRMEEARRVLRASTVELNAHERVFVEDSLRRARRSRRRRIVAYTIIVGALLGDLALTMLNMQASEEQRKLEEENNERLARENQKLMMQAASADAHRALNLIEGPNEREALAATLPWVVKYLLGKDVNALSQDANHALEQILAKDAIIIRPEAVLKGHRDNIRTLAFSSQGELLATAGNEGIIHIWSTAGDLERKLVGHTPGEHVMTLDFSPDGRQLVSASFDGTARIWSLATGETVRVLEHAHESSMTIARYSPDGEQLATADSKGMIELWSSSGERQLTLLDDPTWILALDFAPDGERLVAAYASSDLHVWDVATGELVHVLSGHEASVYDVRYAPDGRTIASASGDGDARVWDAETGELLHVLEGHTQLVFSLGYSPDSRHLVTGSFDHDARVWNVSSGAQVVRLDGHGEKITSVAYRRNGSILSSSVDYTLRLWEPERGARFAHVATFEGHKDQPYAFALTERGDRVASGGMDHDVRVWAPRLDHLDIDAGHDAFIYNLAVAPDERSYATADVDGEIKLWNAASGELHRTLSEHKGGVHAIAYRPAGPPGLASVDQDGMLMLWDPERGELLHPIEAHTRDIYALSYAPDGGTLATGSDDKTVKLWNASSGELVETFAGHTDKIHALRFAPDGKTLATASFDGSVRLWDLETGLCRATLGGKDSEDGHSSWVRGLDFSPDGRRLITAGRKGLAIVWDTRTGRRLARCVGHEAEVFGVVHAPEGQQFATASLDGTARIWDARCTKLHLLAGHQKRINSIAYAPDGDTLVTASDDGTVRLWDPEIGREIGVLEGHDAAVSIVSFAAEGERLISASEDHTAKVWGLAEALELAEIREREGDTEPEDSAELMSLTSSYGRRRADGSLESLNPLELACMGCERLLAFDEGETKLAQDCVKLQKTRCED